MIDAFAKDTPHLILVYWLLYVLYCYLIRRFGHYKLSKSRTYGLKRVKSVMFLKIKVQFIGSENPIKRTWDI